MDPSPSPFSIDKDDESTCASCGSFVGTYFSCPRCGANVEKRMSIKAVKIASVLIATLGLFFIYLWGVATEIPPIKVADINPTMNFAYVKVRGTLTQAPRVHYEEGTNHPVSISMTIDDGTGTIRAGAFRIIATQLVKRHLLPREGDTVEISGPLAIQKDRQPRIFLQTLRHYRVTPKAIPRVSIGELRQWKTKVKVVQVEGLVTRILKNRNSTKRYPVKIGLWDGTGKTFLVLWPDRYKAIKARLGDLKGKALLVTGRFSTYSKKRIELNVDMAEDVQLSPTWKKQLPSQGSAPLVSHPGSVENLSLSKIRDVPLKSLWTIRGMITKIYSPKPGKSKRGRPGKIFLIDGKASAPITIWKKSYEKIMALHHLKKGDTIGAKIKVGEYRKRRELYLQWDKIWLIKGGSKTRRSPKKRPSHSYKTMGPLSLSELPKVPLKSLWIVQGIITAIYPPKPGRSKRGRPGKIYLRQGKTSAPIVIWKKSYKKIMTLHQLKKGDTIRAKVKVSRYGKRRQLSLQWGKLWLVERGETPAKTLPPKKITPKTPIKKAPAKTPVKKTAVKKTPTKTPAKKAPVKTPAKKAPAKTPAKKAPAKAPAKKTTSVIPKSNFSPLGFKYLSRGALAVSTVHKPSSPSVFLLLPKTTLFVIPK